VARRSAAVGSGAIAANDFQLGCLCQTLQDVVMNPINKVSVGRIHAEAFERQGLPASSEARKRQNGDGVLRRECDSRWLSLFAARKKAPTQKEEAQSRSDCQSGKSKSQRSTRGECATEEVRPLVRTRADRFARDVTPDIIG